MKCQRYLARPLLAALQVLLLCAGVASAQAQTPDRGEGVVESVRWPLRLVDAGETLAPFAEAALLPFLDTLSLEYQYAVVGGQPQLSFVLSWMPGTEGLLDGERRPLADFPPDLRLTALDLSLDVVVDGVRVDGLAVSVDSLSLSPAPYVFPFDAGPVDWGLLFDRADAAQAQAYFDAGFALDNLRVLRIAFAGYEAPSDDDPRRVIIAPRPPPPVRTGVYIPRPDVWIAIGRTPYLRPPRMAPAPRRPRGDTMGRGRVGTTERPHGGTRASERGSDNPPDAEAATEARTPRDSERGAAGAGRTTRGRTGKRGDQGGDDEDDEDDEHELLPAALIGVAAVAVVAVAGGTVGYYGDVNRAPIGLASGFVRPQGGLLIRVAVNHAVLGAGDGPERLSGNLLGFYRLFNAPVQPALGVGLWAEADGDDVMLSPSVSVGAIGQWGPVLVQGGYDVAEGTVQMGLAFNFRHRRRAHR